MWHAIKNNNEQNFFFKCSFEEDTFKYYLYNLKEIWSENCNISEIIQRSKNLNKRIHYDKETVISTLKSAKPTTVSIEATDYGNNVILKYHIMERPFNFEWNLTILHKDEFQKIITNPLFMSIHYLAEQIKELKNTIKKKDLEIKQYIAEGAVLERKTVATEEFDEDVFDNRYSHINAFSKDFLEISESIKEQIPLPKVSLSTENSKETTKRASTFTAREKTKKSPNKKRKLLENRRQQMLSIAKSKHNDTMEFESSQSQSMSQSPPKDELAEIYKSLEELNAKRLASTSVELGKDDSF
ncbi:non-homologous end-joining factor 1-like [Episyrphus balteatus]|uniref:non-homologous end-joining factor 1-like n=1 Tax=Episyrphus balteatus TaxID=286459 RepID=UPI002485FEBE|nr:non-homologous end-joining factor 1-like [Episyrphus balteatus]